MIDLLKAELLRFRWWALGAACVQLLVLGFLTRVIDLAQQPEVVYQTFACAYGAVGLLLGLYQMGGYRRPNTWLNLLHRPIAHWKIATALLSAAAILLAVGVLLPSLVVAGWQEWMTARVVDSRHVMLLVSAWMITVCAYLVGCFVMLSNRRVGFCAGVFLALFAASEATGVGALFLQLLAMAWLVAMVLVAFKPDLSAAPRGVARTVLIGAPLNIAMWMALVMVGFGVEFVWIAQGSHPNNIEVPQSGGEKELENAEGKDVFRLGLANSTNPEAPLWREQAQISEIFQVGPDFRTIPARGELMNLAPMEFDDGERRVRWVFSHDAMKFEGYSLVDRRSVGTLGMAGDAPFPAPVIPADEGVLFDRATVYQYDSDAKLMLPRARLPQGERFTGFAKMGDDVAVISDRALYFYDARELENDDGLLLPRQRVPLPGAVGDLQRVDAMELLDGWLLSFSFVRSSYNAEGALPFQQVVRVDEAGHVETIARRDVITDYPVAWRYQNWYTSPVVYAVQKAVKTAFAGGMTPLQKQMPVVPMSMWMLAGALMFASLLLAAWRTRQTDLSMPARIAWILVCGVVSLPAVMALWLLYPRRETVDAVDFIAHPATA